MAPVLPSGETPGPGGAPVTIGPYRLEARLGRGGMGEVYRGYDGRLDRPVALKRIHPGIGDPETALKRFQREARAAARLRHPAIVQVHDWVETGAEAWLVMELVEGVSLRELLRSGPLEPARAIGLARDLLEGLAVAHDAGLVHRDLKPENVMVSSGSSAGRGRAEQAKILDFGLAKQTAGEHEDESGLSVEGKIVGTLSALAPEQVLGGSLDGRTDLFALGSLLYETLTGIQPFLGGSPGETLNRICTHQPPPLAALRSELSASLSSFVDHLLQKDPRRRPASAHDAIAELDGFSSAGSGSLKVLSADEMPTTWEIQLSGLPTRRPAAAASPAAADTAAPAAEAGAVAPLHPSPGRETGMPIAVAPGPPARGDSESRVYDTERFAMPSNQKSVRPAAGEMTGTQALRLVSRLRIAALSTVALMVVAVPAYFFLAADRAAPATLYVVVPETRIEAADLPAAELAARAIHSTLLQGLIDLRGIAAVEVPASSASDDPRALARELAADELLTAGLSCDRHDCRVLLQRVAGADGRVLWAQAFTAHPGELMELSQAVLGFLPAAFPDSERRQGVADFKVRPADYETYLRLFQRFLARDRGLSSDQLLAELTRLGASSPSFLAVPLLEAHVSLQRFQETRTPADLERAERALARALQLAPEDPQVLMLAARAARQAGDLDVAASRLEEVRRLEPGNAETVLQQALLAERRGQPERALELAAQAAEQRPSTGLLLNVSDIFGRQGNVAAARRHIERALERAPKSFGALSRLAQLELTHGALERAAELYAQLVERSPESAELANLGTAQMMLGRFDQAAESFAAVAEKSPSSPQAALSLADIEELRGRREAAAALYRRVVELAAADRQPELLDSVKAQALAHLGRREEAVAALQQALRRQPDDPWTAYEAALVFALIGDDSSAVYNARRARRLGIEPRWFALPFFDPVRAALEPAVR